MTPFGPFYPPRLQASVNHAERLAHVLTSEERRTTDARHVAAWLVGRAGELERFVDAVVQQWRDRVRHADEASVAIDAYIAALHDGLAARLGITGPPCCRTDTVTTETPQRRGRADRQHRPATVEPQRARRAHAAAAPALTPQSGARPSPAGGRPSMAPTSRRRAMTHSAASVAR